MQGRYGYRKEQGLSVKDTSGCVVLSYTDKDNGIGGNMMSGLEQSWLQDTCTDI